MLLQHFLYLNQATVTTTLHIVEVAGPGFNLTPLDDPLLEFLC
jgi:hypothetical protein